MENGKISVIMGIYNCADTLGDAIDSIVAQTYTNWELILCDDCSTDGRTYELAEKYREKYPDKIILLKNEVNSKLAFTLNHCLEAATGEYVARMDGDDISLPDRFEKQLAFLNSRDGIIMCGTAMQRFSTKGLGAVDKAPAEPDKFNMRKGTTFNHATILCRKEMYDKLGGYTVLPRTVRGQDRDLWFRFFKEGFKGANMDEPLYMVREDLDAVKRRTVKDRWIHFQTVMYGYKLLGFPWHWYIGPILELGKILVPTGAILWYRDFQKKKSKN